MLITNHIHALKIPFQVPISADQKIDRFVYVYLVYGERIWLIDTGVASAGPLIFDYIRETERDPKDIAGIVLTHSHPDHIGAAKYIQDATACVVAVHAAERNWIEDVGLQERERPVPGFRTLVGGPVSVDRILNEGDVLDIGNGIRLEVFHTPGHSSGSVSLLLREERVLFSGDAVPIPGEMPIYEDAFASARSIEKLKSIDQIKFLLASWDDPRENSSVYETMDNGLRYLKAIDEAVVKIGGSGQAGDAMALCNDVLRELRMPPSMANPLIARSFQSNLRLSGRGQRREKH